MLSISRFRLAVVVLVLVAIGAALALRGRCVSASLAWGVRIPVCPEGDVHTVLDVRTDPLRRGIAGVVYTSAALVYVTEGETEPTSTPLEVQDARFTLVRGQEETALEADRAAKEGVPALPPATARITLPRDLPDGDYVLRTRALTRAGEIALDTPLPVYAPATVHVMTDRPLYEAGHTVKFRGLVLRTRDLAPLDKRPGVWSVVDPQGVTVLEERVEAGELGVVDGELPLDKASAPEGMWRVRFTSGGVVGEAPFAVRPFELPRFTVNVESATPFARAAEMPRVRVDVRSAAGVPVPANLELTWRVLGAWQPPEEWTKALPARARTDRTGRVELELPRVPADLMGKASVLLHVGAVDGTGDRANGTGAVLLAEDAIAVDVITELGVGAAAGLVEGINNRAYLRVTTAAGAALAGATVTVKRAWDKKDKGVEVETDEDGVAALQIDPGPAVTVVIPPLPVRLPPPPPPVERTSLVEELFGAEIPLKDVVTIDGWNTAVGACARFAQDSESATVQLRVEPSGRVARAATSSALSDCIGGTLTGRTLSAGGPRVLRLDYTLRPSLASFSFEALGAELPSEVAADLERRLLDARRCLGRLTRASSLPRVWMWEQVGARFSASFARDTALEDADLLDAGRTACLEGALAGLFARTLRGAGASAVDDADGADDGEGGAGGATLFGAVRFSVEPIALPDAPERARPTTMLGYELLVSARKGDSALGETRLRVRPGEVPPIRLRASQVIAEAGAEIDVEILRGPGFEGELPKKLVMTSHADRLEADFDAEKKRARFKLPADRDGWYDVQFGGATTRVFVPKKRALTVAVTPDKQTYRPGEMAKLAVSTREGDSPSAASVGLFGVDATLAQVTALPGPDALDGLTPTVTLSQPAFGVIDAAALSLGRVRGKNAAAATVLLVTSVPAPSDVDVTTSAAGQTVLDPLSPLADRFYTVLESLYAEVRAFEASAERDEKLTPQRMLALWDRALERTEKSGKPITDFFGRRIRLAMLPDALIALTDPRVLVADGTRLPEDIEAWVPFVRKNQKGSRS